MEYGSSLIASAQIAIAIAGFAGIVAMFRSESPDKWGPVERFWLRLLLFNSILPLAFSMFGLFLLVALPAPSAVWRFCSVFAALSLLPYATMIIRNLVGFGPEPFKEAGGGRITGYALFAVLTAVWILQLLNIMFLGVFWPFFGVIVALLLGAMYQFVRLVLTPQQPQGEQ